MAQTKSGEKDRANASQEPPKQSVLKKMLVRTVVGTLMLGFFYFMIATRPFEIIPCFVLAVQIVGFNEVVTIRHSARKERDLILFRTQCWYWALVFLFSLYGVGAARSIQRLIPDIFSEEDLEFFLHYHLWITFSLGISAFIGFIMTLRKGLYKYQFTQLSWTLLSIVMSIGNLYIVIANLKSGLFWFVLPSSLIICNDIMAYFCGIALGKKLISRPFIQLSPNKTWEGFIGAFFCTLGFAWMFSGFLGQFPLMHCPEETLRYGATSCEVPSFFVPKFYKFPDFANKVMVGLGYEERDFIKLIPAQIHSLILSIFASLIAPFGGFFASGMKRAFGVKDFGAYFPGHGGVFDRMDCQWIMHIAVYAHVITFVLPRHSGFPSVLGAVFSLPEARQRELLDILQNKFSQ